MANPIQLLMGLAIIFNISTFGVYAQDIPSYSFEELTAPQNVIEIRLSEEDYILKEPVVVFPDTYLKDGAESLHGRLTSTVLFNDRKYVADDNHQKIYIASDENQLEWVFGREGRGPSEFTSIYHLAANSSSLFVQEIHNLKTQVFDENMEFTGEFLSGGMGRLGANDSYILAPASFGSEHYISVLNAHPPFKQIGSFINNLIGPGEQPGGFAFAHTWSSADGRFVVNINGMPYLFLFDSQLRHIVTLKISNHIVEAIVERNPEPVPVQPANYRGSGVQGIFGKVTFTDDNTLLIGLRTILYEIRLSEDLDYETSVYRFLHSQASDFSDGDESDKYVHTVHNTIQKDRELICMASPVLENVHCYPWEGRE